MYGYTNEHRKLPKWLVALVIAGGLALGGCVFWFFLRLEDPRGVVAAVLYSLLTVFLFWQLIINCICRNILAQREELRAKLEEIRVLQLEDNKGRPIKKYTQYFLVFADDPESYRVTYVVYKRFAKLAEADRGPIICSYEKRQSIYGAIVARKIKILEEE